MHSPESLHRLVQSSSVQDNVHLAWSHVHVRIGDRSTTFIPVPPRKASIWASPPNNRWPGACVVVFPHDLASFRGLESPKPSYLVAEWLWRDFQLPISYGHLVQPIHGCLFKCWSSPPRRISGESGANCFGTSTRHTFPWRFSDLSSSHWAVKEKAGEWPPRWVVRNNKPWRQHTSWTACGYGCHCPLFLSLLYDGLCHSTPGVQQSGDQSAGMGLGHWWSYAMSLSYPTLVPLHVEICWSLPTCSKEYKLESPILDEQHPEWTCVSSSNRESSSGDSRRLLCSATWG